MAWTEPGRAFGTTPIPIHGQHGSPRCRTQMAIVSGGDERVRGIARQLERSQPSVLDWAPMIARLLQLDEGDDVSGRVDRDDVAAFRRDGWLMRPQGADVGATRRARRGGRTTAGVGRDRRAGSAPLRTDRRRRGAGTQRGLRRRRSGPPRRHPKRHRRRHPRPTVRRRAGAVQGEDQLQAAGRWRLRAAPGRHGVPLRRPSHLVHGAARPGDPCERLSVRGARLRGGSTADRRARSSRGVDRCRARLAAGAVGAGGPVVLRLVHAALQRHEHHDSGTAGGVPHLQRGVARRSPRPLLRRQTRRVRTGRR